MSLMLATCSMAEGVEGDAGVCEKEEVKPDNDRIWKTPMDERISVLLNNDLMSDIKFSVNGKRFHAHKFVLSYASEVFYAMFNGPLADDSEEIEVADCEKPEDFLEFLSLIYRKSAKVTWENVHQLSHLRRKYMIMETRPFSNFIESIVDTDNCLDALDTSIELEEDDMAEECLKIIRRDITVLVMTQGFLELRQPALKAILKQDMLNINELDLFLAVDKWCTYQVVLKESEGEKMKKREVLGDALYHVRFPVIKLDDFVMHCRPSKLLTNKEIVDLYDTLLLRPDDLVSTGARKSFDEDDGNVSENESDASNLVSDFSTEPRMKGKTIVPIIENESLYAHSVPQPIYGESKLTIKVNKMAWLVGLKVLGSWMEFIKVESFGKLKLQGVKEKLARLEKPLCLEPRKEYMILCDRVFKFIRFPGASNKRSTAFRYYGFRCSVTQPSEDNISTISELIFSTFDGKCMSSFGVPPLNMTATAVQPRR